MPDLTDFEKDPSAHLDWQWDWSDWLEDTEFISTVTVTPDVATLIVDPIPINDGSKITTWLSGGVASTIYTVSCYITTNHGRSDTRSMTLSVFKR